MKFAEGLDSEMMATKVERVPERLSPANQSGRLILSEHSGRYMWAAQLASRMNVLDAGCGTGYGAQILADGGASRVVGVDISETAIAEAAQYRNPLVEFSLGDLTDLPFSDCE